MADSPMEQHLKSEFEALKGKYKHYCYDWDGLPVDETCLEFAYCNCEHDGLKESTRHELKEGLLAKDAAEFEASNCYCGKTRGECGGMCLVQQKA